MKLNQILPLIGLSMLQASCAAWNADSLQPETQLEAQQSAVSMAAPLFGDVPEGAQAVSFLGKALYSAEPDQILLDNLAVAKANYDTDPNDADNLVWYGRRLAYAGDYRRAIEIYSEGIAKHPQDARMYRHRGHRYISIREIDKAVTDFETAVQLIEGAENRIELSSARNPQGINLATTHGNIYYHLGLAYYLRQEWQNSYDTFKLGQEIGNNDDNIVSTGHWMYMNLRRMGRNEEAQASLHNINQDMNIIENMSYHNLTLMYKGEIPAQQLTDVDPNDPSGAAIAYGVANWFLYNGETEKAYDLMARFLETSSWPAFGFIAAEKDLSLMEAI